ncbi:ZNF70-like protein [Mya arenaria]|uniref:ZNF70-like protein n=1 Tax=Mya arenaria TaxID=6604 RepID=A0ABY7F8H7_MYAAR|nr:ZNF70-like protein [Mya arenaria]
MEQKWENLIDLGLGDLNGQEEQRNPQKYGNKNVCPYCGLSWRVPAELRRHIVTHTGEKPFKCSICGTGFSRKNTLQYHVLSTHSQAVQEPSTVPNIFQTQENTTLFFPAMSYICGMCGKQLKSKSGLSKHERKHGTSEDFKCITCGQTFTNRSSYQDHTKHHNADKPFGCTECGKYFKTKRGLHFHRLSENKKLTCETCGKRFEKRREYENHVTMHTGEKKEKCDKCGKHFRFISNLRRHKKTHADEYAA